jgi:putative nucleotidyltransferase with HDIG domain
VHTVAEIVAGDTGLTAKVLQLANSAFFRLARRITSAEKAVGHLGLAVMRSLMSSTDVFWRGAEHESATLRLDELQRHACMMGAAARSLAQDLPQADDAWAAGLLHDVGYSILARDCQADLLRCLDLAAAEGLQLHEAETRILGATHAQLGAYLLGLWGLPSEVVEAVACHHAPEAARQTPFGALGALTIAQSLCHAGDAEIFHGRTVPAAVVDPGFLKSVNAPFDWAEATRRVEASRRSMEALS